MTARITRLTRAIGALVDGIQLADATDQDSVQWLTEKLIEHEVLFFRQQELTPEQQSRFAAGFGKLHVHPIYPSLPERPEILLLDTHAGFLPDNDTWHTDVTFDTTPPAAALLAAKRIPAVGGDTLWASGTAAYEGLSAPFRQFLEGLTAEHSVVKSFPAGRWAATPADKERYDAAVAKHPPVLHPVIRSHPVSGRKALFVNEGFTTRITELSEKESDAILRQLFRHIARPEFTIRWHWQERDVAFWDNRVTQHYAVADYLPERRIMHRATIIGDRPYL